MFTEDTLKNKLILVTGGGSGLGLAMAKGFNELGATVAICGRTESKLLEAKKKFKYPDKALTYVVDVRNYEAVGKMFQEIEKKTGRLVDGLVNNAAGNFLSNSEDLSPNAFKSIIDIVLIGTFNCTQHFGKSLIGAKQKGNIINIVTTYTETGSGFVLPSACAKAGVYALTTSLAFEWATYGIRLNAIAPGPFPTKGAWSRLIPDPNFEVQFKNRIPLGRYGNPEELSNLANFLMSDLSSYITGECITIDGGERLRTGQFSFIADLAPREKLKQLFDNLKPKKD